MRALVWDGSEAAVRERPDPRPDEGMAVVRVRLAGICRTDLEILRGYMGFRGVLGHEFTGVVEAGPEEWRERRVVGEINFACGECSYCEQNLARHCPTRRVMGILRADGAFAERVAVPVANLHALPENVSDEDAVFVEPLAAALEILEQVPLEPGARCIVMGDGKLGLLIAQVLQRAGARVLAVGRHAAKLALLERLGIATRLAADFHPGAERADVVVEATGRPEGFALAVAATRPRGTLVLKSTLAERSAVELAPLVIDEIQVVGSRCGPFPPALAALAEQGLAVAPLVSDRYPLARAREALAHAGERGVLKVLLDCA